MEVILKSPEPLSEVHLLDSFDSGNEELNYWLKNRALRNERAFASRTFVTCDQDNKVRGYYCLSAGSVSPKEVIGKVRRNMPNPIPVMVLGRLAIDKPFQKKGLGRALLKNALLRTLQASEIAGIKALIVHAIDQNAVNFYMRAGFKESPLNPRTLMLPLEEVINELPES